MYLAPLTGLFVTALKETLGPTYPVEGLRDLYVSVEYPIEQAHFPAIWVDYDDTDAVKRAGVDHTEIMLVPTDIVGDNEEVLVTRWKFEGYVTLTVAALSSLERDSLYDEIVGMLAFGIQDPDRGVFRSSIETNDFIAVNANWDTVQPRGSVAAPGTPWGTDEIVYERTINIDVMGEFVPDPRQASELLRLSEIIVKGYNLDSPQEAAALAEATGGATGLGPTQWH